MSKIDANSDDNKREGAKEVLEVVTMTRSGRVLNFIQNEDFKYDLHYFVSFTD